MKDMDDLFSGGPNKAPELREYQKEAVDSIHQAIEEGHNPLLIMATGTGKTVVFSKVIGDFFHNNKNSLVIAHREELINQAIASIQKETGYVPRKEKARFKASPKARVVVASVPTLQNSRVQKFAPDWFRLMVTDEAHHAVADTYKNIYEYFNGYSHLGVTATPDRADEKRLGKIFTKVAYEYSLPKAINEGHLARLFGKRVQDFDIDLSGLKVVAGDYQESDLAHVVERYVGPIAYNVEKETKDLKTLIFMPNVASSELIAGVLREKGLKAASLSGKQDENTRRDILYRFSKGQITHLASCNILLEGYDEPTIEAIVMLRPTGSRAVYSQAVGRGTRKAPGKDSLLLLEFTYNSSRLPLVSPFELFSTEGFGSQVQRKAANSLQTDVPVDLLAALSNAHDSQYALQNILDRMVVKDYEFTTFDPFALGDLIGVDLSGEFNISYQGRRLVGGVTPKQAELLRRYGVAQPEQLDKAQASVLISTLFEKNLHPIKGPVTPRQQFFLKKQGIDAKGMTKAQASLLINELKENKNGRPVGDKERTDRFAKALNASAPLSF